MYRMELHTKDGAQPTRQLWAFWFLGLFPLPHIFPSKFLSLKGLSWGAWVA